MQNKTEKKKSVIPSMVFTIGSALIISGIAYVKSADFRQTVDTQVPWVKETLAKNGIQLGQTTASVESPSEPVAPDPGPDLSISPEPQESFPMVTETETPAPVESSASVTVDIHALAANRAEWPKKLLLKNIITFPVVMNGKVVGKLKAPVGSVVNLVVIRDGKLGVEYKGGGAMVEPADTDMIERVLASRGGASASSIVETSVPDSGSGSL